MLRLLTALLFSSSHILLGATPAALPRPLVLNAQQQAALGIQLAPIQAAQSGLWLASASVSLPPGKEVSVSAPYAGVISRIDVGLGDRVHAGASLATWSSPQLGDARRQTREAQLESQIAQAALQRDQALLAEGVIPSARLQLSQNKFQAAEAMRLAKESELRSSGASAATGDYASAVLRAPLAGSVVEVAVAVGQRVEAGALLFKVADTRQLQLDLTLSPDKAAQLRVGDGVTVPGRNAQGVLVGIGQTVDASQQTRARARLTQAANLRAGEVLTVHLQPRQTLPAPGGAPTPTVWQVPARAVISHQSQSWVFVANATGLVPQVVKLLSSNDDQAFVQGQLQVQSRVAVTGLASLRAMLQKDE